MIMVTAIVPMLPLVLASELLIGLVVLVLKVLMQPCMLFGAQALIMRVLMDLIELIMHIIVPTINALVFLLMLALASDLLIGLVVLILKIPMQPGMLFRGQALVVGILMSLIELIVHVTMLLVGLLRLRTGTACRMSSSRNCKSNHRCGTNGCR
jgi:hypothetical protein